MKQRRMLFAVIAMLVITSLACSLGGSSDTTQPTSAPSNPNPQPQSTAIAEQPTAAAQATSTEPPIAEQPTITPQAATSAPSATPTNTPLSGTGPGGCVLGAAFVADVTIPDNQVEAPNAAFVKTWRIKNTGTCVWDPSYQLVFASGDQMSGPAGVPINNTAPGANLDVSVSLKAPGTQSATPYVGKWTLKASNGVIFGGQYTVVIVVPLPATATATSTVGSGPWNGHWEVNCSDPECNTAVDLVQVGNSVLGTFGGGGTINATDDGSGTHLSGTFHVGGGTGSFDWWLGGSGNKFRGNWGGLGSNFYCGWRTGSSAPAPCGVGTFAGDWTVTCTSCSGAMHLEQNGQNFTGTYVNGTVDGTIDGNVATGQWHIGISHGALTWNLVNFNKFQGNWGGTNQWCGVRTGSGASNPAPCLWP